MRQAARWVTILTAALALLTLIAEPAISGCLTARPYFDLTDKKTIITGGTLAVISGYDSPATVTLAEMVTAGLQKKSTLKIMSQQEIRQRAPKYPYATIETDDDPDSASSGGSDRWSESVRLGSLQKKLRTDYVLVIRGHNLTKVMTKQYGIGMLIPAGSGSMEMSASTEFYRYPEGRQIGASAFTMSEHMGFTTDVSKEDNAYVEKLLLSVATAIVDNFIDATKSGKSSRRGDEWQ